MTDSRNLTGAIQMNSETTTLTTTQAAITACVRINSVQQLIYAGRLKAQKCPDTGRWLIDKDSFDAWLVQRKRRKAAA